MESRCEPGLPEHNATAVVVQEFLTEYLMVHTSPNHQQARERASRFNGDAAVLYSATTAQLTCINDVGTSQQLWRYLGSKNVLQRCCPLSVE